MAVSLLIAAPIVVGAATGHVARHMPRLIGLSRAQVYAVMRADGLYFQTKGPGSENTSWVTVTAQSPAPGVLVAWHSQATLTTSMTSSRGLRAMPRLIGLDRAQVYGKMRRAQLFFTTSGSGSTTDKWVVVLRQSPAPGTRVRWHSSAELIVGAHRPAVKRSVPVKKTVTTTTVKKTTTIRKSPTTTSTTPVATTTTTTTVPGSTTTTYLGETTTTTIAPPTTTTIKKRVVTKVAVRYRIGDATWYSYFPGRCATWFLPMGTRVTVRNLATGKAVICIVADHEAAHGSRVVDLSETDFARLQPLWRGVVLVKVSW